MYKKINLFALIIVGFLPLFNGGKGFGAFCATIMLLSGLCLWVLHQLRQDEVIALPASPYFKVLVFGFYGLASLNLFFTVYLYATAIEWIRLTGYLSFFLLLIFSASQNRKAFSSCTRNMLVVAAAFSLLEALMMIIQSYLRLPPRGTLPNENVAASYILIGLMVALSYLFVNQDSSRREKIIIIPGVLILLLALTLSRSRGIIIALIVAIGILSKIRFRKWGLIVSFLAVLGILAFLPVTFFDEIFKMNVPYSYRRIYIWQSAWEIIKNRPWFGWGMGNFGLVYPRYNLPSFDSVLHYGKVTRFAHNEFLQVAAEMGLPAMVLYSMIIAYVGKAGRNIILKKNISWMHTAALASLGGVIAHSLVDFNLHLPAITFLSVMLGTVLLLEAGLNRDQTYAITAGTKKITSLLLASILGLILLMFTGYIFTVKAEKGEARKEPLPVIIRAYKTAQFFDPLNSYHHEKLARLYASQYHRAKDIVAGEMAISEYSKASRLNPEEASLYEDLFYLYYIFGSPLPNMEQNYVQVMARNPYLVKPTLILSVFHMQRKNYGRAIKLLSEVIDKEPNYLSAYYYLAVCYEYLGDSKSACRNYEIIVQKQAQHLDRLVQSSYELQALQVPQVDVYTRLGIIYNLERRYVQAVTTLKQALALAPDQIEALNALAGSYFSQGQYQLALPYAQKAVRLAPKNLEFKRNLDLCLQKISLPSKP
jgi:O-antigen ligase/tetratricopeptide (TPR) repeat protein